MQIRDLLSLDPESPERAKRLYPLVEPVCTDAKARADFIDVARWSASFAHDTEMEPQILALDTVEYVATSCSRNYPDAALEIIDAAKKAVPDPARFAVIGARLRAASGDLPGALAAAKAAAETGSIHAVALAANIEAQIERSKIAGYHEGMLDEAIKTVSGEPDRQWRLVDLAAVLTTRAHLLTERAIWEPAEKSLATRKLAQAAYKRLTVGPFIATMRTHARDVLCFDSVELPDPDFHACQMAVDEAGNLGGAVLAGAPRDPKVLDLERLAKLEKLRDDLGSLPKGSLVLLVFRGDEQELITWALPASRLIARVARLGLPVAVIDRTRSARTAALVDRIVAISGVKPLVRVSADDTLAMPCVTAIVAGRKTPPVCPVSGEAQGVLAKHRKFGVAFLIGRDLDAEIDDLRLYQLRTALLSFRLPQIERGVDLQLKSLSDVWIVAPPGSKR